MFSCILNCNCNSRFTKYINILCSINTFGRKYYIICTTYLHLITLIIDKCIQHVSIYSYISHIIQMMSGSLHLTRVCSCIEKSLIRCKGSNRREELKSQALLFEARIPWQGERKRERERERYEEYKTHSRELEGKLHIEWSDIIR